MKLSVHLTRGLIGSPLVTRQ